MYEIKIPPLFDLDDLPENPPFSNGLTNQDILSVSQFDRRNNFVQHTLYEVIRPVIDKMKSLELEDVDAYTKWQGVSVLDYGSMITNKDKLYGCATSLDKELADANIYISKATSYYRIVV